MSTWMNQGPQPISATPASHLLLSSANSDVMCQFENSCGREQLTCELVVAEDQLGDVRQGDWNNTQHQVNTALSHLMHCPSPLCVRGTKTEKEVIWFSAFEQAAAVICLSLIERNFLDLYLTACTDLVHFSHLWPKIKRTGAEPETTSITVFLNCWEFGLQVLT